MPEYNTGVRKALSINGAFSVHWFGTPRIEGVSQVITYPGAVFCEGSFAMPGMFSVGWNRFQNYYSPSFTYQGPGYDFEGTYLPSGFFEAGTKLTCGIIPACDSLVGDDEDIVGFSWAYAPNSQYSGLVTCSGLVEAELWRIEGQILDNFELIDGVRWPEYPGGTAVPDGLPGRAVRWEWRTFEGAEITVEASGGLTLPGALSVSRSGIINADGAGLVVPVDGSAQSVAILSGSGVGTIQRSFKVYSYCSDIESPYSALSDTAVKDGSIGAFKMACGNGVSEVELTDMIGGWYYEGESTFITCISNGSLPYAYSLSGALEGINDPLPIGHVLKDTSGFESSTINRLIKLYNYENVAEVSVYTDSGRVVHSTGGTDFTGSMAPFYAYFLPGSLNAAGDDGKDYRVMFRGDKWTVGTVRHADELTIAETITISTSTTHSVSVSPAINSILYRYLRLRIKADSANAPMTVVVDGRDYTIETGAADTYTEVDIDLCVPDGLGVGNYVTESMFPLSSPRIPGTTPGILGPLDEMYGPCRISGLGFNGLDDTVTYDIEFIKLISVGPCKFTPNLPSFNYKLLAWESDTDNTYAVPSIYFNVDGRVNLDSSMYLIVSDPDVREWRWYTCSEFLSVLDEYSGLTVTENSTFAKPWHGNSLEALNIKPVIDQDITASTFTVEAHKMFDHVQTLPGTGNLFSNEVLGNGIPLPFEKILRTQAWGLSLGDDGLVFDRPVTLRRGGDFRGSGLPDSIGAYKTRLPYGNTSTSNLTVDPQGDAPDATIVPANRSRRRACFVSTQPEEETIGSISKDEHGDRRLIRCVASSDGVAVFESRNRVTGAYSIVAQHSGIFFPCIRFLKLSGKDELLLVHQASDVASNIISKRSSDSGVTLSMATTIFTGSYKYPACLALPDGVICYYAFLSGAIRLKRFDKAGNLIGSEVTVISGVDDSPFAVERITVEQNKTLYILSAVQGGSVKEFRGNDPESLS